VEAAALGLAVAASLVLGAAAARVTLPGRVAAGLTAFGGGLLLAAAVLELVPEARTEAGMWVAGAGLVAGMLAYVGADAWLTRDDEARMMRRSGQAAAAGAPMAMPKDEVARGESIAAGLAVDGVPESVALGLTAAEGEIGLALLVGIVVGNLLEAYGAAQPIVAGGRSPRFALGLMSVIAAALWLATVLGATVLAEAPRRAIGLAEAVAAGGVLALIAIAIVPHVFDEVRRWAAAATVLGFVAGFLLSS
jgi:ZIP family zinc transporter